jgi:hypothetical protein
MIAVVLGFRNPKKILGTPLPPLPTILYLGGKSFFSSSKVVLGFRNFGYDF